MHQTTLLIDCGPGVVLGLTTLKLLKAIEGVVITHRHADHCADLLALAYHRLFPNRQPPLPLFGPPDLQEVLAGLDHLFGIPSLPALSEPLTAAFSFQAVPPGESFAFNGLPIDTLPTVHPVPTMALRWPDATLVYTADGALTDALVHFARGSKTIIAEATYISDTERTLKEHGHMTAYQAGLLAQQSQADRLILTHLSRLQESGAAQQEAARVFSGSIESARPGLWVQLK
jgi:ribonuclease BN (tRNA processing enzyme)